MHSQTQYNGLKNEEILDHRIPIYLVGMCRLSQCDSITVHTTVNVCMHACECIINVFVQKSESKLPPKRIQPRQLCCLTQMLRIRSHHFFSQCILWFYTQNNINRVLELERKPAPKVSQTHACKYMQKERERKYCCRYSLQKRKRYAHIYAAIDVEEFQPNVNSFHKNSMRSYTNSSDCCTYIFNAHKIKYNVQPQLVYCFCI